MLLDLIVAFDTIHHGVLQGQEAGMDLGALFCGQQLSNNFGSVMIKKEKGHLYNKPKEIF